MVSPEQISTVIDAQKDLFLQRTSFPRESLKKVQVHSNFATIITGLRRCGKSTLLFQLLKKRKSTALYLNFEDTRLAGFDIKDFARLGDEIKRRKVYTLLFDEIQLIKGWEIFIHQKLNEGYIILISGSNASLLSRELGTHLTGRHLSYELFPFSYPEFVKFRKLRFNEKSLEEYLFCGGLPEYLKTGTGDILNSLLDDVLMRDIAIRHNIRDFSSLQQLSVHLMSNICTPVSAKKLEGLFGIKANSTILEYFSHFKDAYLFEFVPQFSHSTKIQMRNPRKVYTLDLGLYSQNATTFSDNLGRRLENLIYIHLRNTLKKNLTEIYYYKGKGECDFVVTEKFKVTKLIQVCYKIDDMNFNREYNGLLEAMKELKLKEGIIVTFNQTDFFEDKGYKIKVIPAYEYLKNELTL